MSTLGRRVRELGQRLLAISALGSLVSSCSVHPLPEDFTGLSTYSIVRQIRCETREAAIGSILRFLTDEANHKGEDAAGNPKVDDNSRTVGLKFAAGYR